MDVMEQGKVLAETESLHGVNHRPAAQIRFAVYDVQNGGTGKGDFQIRVRVVYLFQFARPVLVFMHLVYIQMFSSVLDKTVRQIYQRVRSQIQRVSRDIQTLLPVTALCHVLQ